MNYKLRTLVAFAVSCMALPASAFETPTHEILTNAAAQRSVLATTPAVLSALGFPDWAAASYGLPDASKVTAAQAMKFGAVMEDNDYGWRAFNHYFDPQFSRPAGRGLTTPKVVGVASPDWILEDARTQTDYNDGKCATRATATGCPQEYSFRKAQQQLYLALTAETAAERAAAQALVMRNLGHVVHHIQDMAQPEHTRNDQHTHPAPMAGASSVRSLYEIFTNDDVKAMTDAVLSSYAIPTAFTTARQFWSTPNATVAQYKGMAEFTAHNFTSFGTQFIGKAGDARFVGAAPGLSLPSGANRAIATYAVAGGSADYVVGKVFDGQTNTSSADMPLAAVSILSSMLPGGALFTEDREVFKARNQILLPRAVAFSTGLINHFFRGQLDLTQNAGTNNAWTLKNTGAQKMIGTFVLYSEDAAFKRTLIPGTMSYRTLVPNGSLTLNVTPPAGTVKMVVAFRGMIGDEGNPQVPDWSAVAGKVTTFAYNEPETVIVGATWASAESHIKYGFRWSSKTGFKALPLAQGAFGSEAVAVSPDGRTVVGLTSGAKPGKGFNFADPVYVMNGIQLPQPAKPASATDLLNVATSWTVSGAEVGKAALLVTGSNASEAWTVSNGGKQIGGTADLSPTRHFCATWDQALNITYAPVTSCTRPVATVLTVNGGQAVHTANGKSFTIPVPSGHNAIQVYQTVLVP